MLWACRFFIFLINYKSSKYKIMDFVQKAKELVEKFSNVGHCGIRHFPNQSYCDCDGGMNNHMAKQCALISINEIIEAIDWHSFETPNAEISYWESVKKEVELL